MEYMGVALIVITIIFYIIIWSEKHIRIKKYGQKAEAEVLGYYITQPYNNVLYIVLKFQDVENIEHIIIKNIGRRSSKYGIIRISPYKVGSKIDIKYVKGKEEYRVDKFIEPINLLESGKRVQPTDDGELFDIEYNSNWNSKDFYGLLIIMCFLIIILIVALLIAII